MKKKIFNIIKLKEKLKNNKKKKIVLCHGVFDLFHIGHLRHLKFAKSLGDILIVSLTKDKYINKGFGKPIFHEDLRAELMSSLSEVDYVVLNENETARFMIQQIKPHIYCKGKEYKNSEKDITKNILIEKSEVKKYGGKIVFSDDIIFSSSKLINENFDIYSSEQNNTVQKIRKNFTIDDIVSCFEKISKLKILVLGEIILDEYIFSDTIGKSGKDPILILKELKKERYIGGAGSIAKNVSGFVKNNQISLISYIGQKRENLKDINEYLGKNIKKYFVNKKNSRTILKRKYLDVVNNTKLLGVYDLNDQSLSQSDELKILKYLKNLSKKHDLIIATDYGHGLLTKKIAKYLTNSSKFITLNSQVNSVNIGYQTLKNYNNLHCLIINERELRHEYRDKKSSVKSLILQLAKEKNFKIILVTRGSSGSMLYEKKTKKFYICPAFANKVTDKIGAGDTLFTVFSLCIRCNVNIELALFISSIAAAENIKEYANKKLVGSNLLFKTLSHVLK